MVEQILCNIFHCSNSIICLANKTQDPVYKKTFLAGNFIRGDPHYTKYFMAILSQVPFDTSYERIAGNTIAIHQQIRFFKGPGIDVTALIFCLDGRIYMAAEK